MEKNAADAEGYSVAEEERIFAARRALCNIHDVFDFGEFSGEFNWSEWSDSNTRPPRPERGALPDCATLRDQWRRL